MLFNGWYRRFFVTMSNSDGYDALYDLRSADVEDSPMIERSYGSSLRASQADLEDLAVPRRTYSFFATVQKALRSNLLYLRNDEDVAKWTYLESFCGQGRSLSLVSLSLADDVTAPLKRVRTPRHEEAVNSLGAESGSTSPLMSRAVQNCPWSVKTYTACTEARRSWKRPM